MRTLVPLVALLGPAVLGAQGGDPDVFLATLIRRGTTVTVGTPVNLTARPGYDNQPAFSPDGRSLYYTSTREDGQADIYRVALGSRVVERVTRTAPESEYSATPMPGRDALSVVRVERDSTQRLWEVPLDGGTSRVLLEHVKPVGYHAWGDDSTLVLFVLGAPPTLQLANLRTGTADTVDDRVGRSLHRVPGRHAVSYVSKADTARWRVMVLDLATRAREPVATMPHGVEDYAWLPDGRLVAGEGSRLLLCDPRSGGGWQEIADLAAAGLSGITRLAVSPSGDRIAIVAVPAGGKP
jgi:dipeptidyl aminopeptidase/acylaminoacyl peptidase